jgi:uncharacterized low-complexity protein
MSKKSIKPVAGAVGAAIAGTMMLAGAASAADNPFGMTELNHGYMQIASAADGKCGAKKVEEEAKCGASKQAAPAPAEGKCGAKEAPVKKKVDGKCGTAKCGANKK